MKNEYIIKEGDKIIPNEIPEGKIDGVNKNFKVAGRNIKCIIKLIFDGAETNEFNYNKNIITFKYAPEHNVTVGYIS